MHKQSEADWAPLPTLSAFTEAEVAAVEQWVRSGGSLLLIADHMPLAGHAEALAAAFGIRFQNGFAQDAKGNGQMTFRRSDGSLPASVIADGRGTAERVDSVMTFTGQAFRLDPAVKAEPLLVLRGGDRGCCCRKSRSSSPTRRPGFPPPISCRARSSITARGASPCSAKPRCSRPRSQGPPGVRWA